MKYCNQIMIRGKHMPRMRDTVPAGQTNTSRTVRCHNVFLHLFLAINLTSTYSIPEKNVEIFN